jgi:two-component system response regulator MprA
MAKGPVLVVDDDRTIRETLSEVLEDEGYRVQVAQDGAEALGLMESTAPRLIVLDLWMPVMDGWTFAREARARGYPGAIIVLTAAQNALRAADPIEADAILAKPFDLDDLIQHVARLCTKAA